MFPANYSSWSSSVDTKSKKDIIPVITFFIRYSISMDTHITIVWWSASVELAKKISEKVWVPYCQSVFKKFSDGEFKVRFDESIRGKQVFIVQSTFPPGDNWMELFLWMDAAKRASAGKIIAVIPYYGFARQDKKKEPRVPISAKAMANLLTASGADQVITVDLHADQIQGFFEIPLNHIHASKIFIPIIKQMKLKNPVIVAADVWGSKRAEFYSEHIFGSELIICYKKRLEDNKVKEIRVLGNVQDKDAIIVEDMIDTWWTIIEVAKALKAAGAKSIRVIASHGIFSGEAHQKFEDSPIDEIIVTDSIPLHRRDEKKFISSKIKVESIAWLLGNVIMNIYNNKSLSEHYY